MSITAIITIIIHYLVAQTVSQLLATMKIHVEITSKVWKISNVTHNNILPFMHNCYPIEVIL